MFAVEFQPALFPRRRRHAIFAPGNMIAGLVERRLAIQGFEFKRLLDREANEDALPVFRRQNSAAAGNRLDQSSCEVPFTIQGPVSTSRRLR